MIRITNFSRPTSPVWALRRGGRPAVQIRPPHSLFPLERSVYARWCEQCPFQWFTRTLWQLGRRLLAVDHFYFVRLDASSPTVCCVIYDNGTWLTVGEMME